MKRITVDQGPTVLAVNSNGSRIYVANLPSSTVSVIDTATDTVIRSPITFGALPFGLAVTPDERRVYVGNSGSNTVSVIDTKSMRWLTARSRSASHRPVSQWTRPGAASMWRTSAPMRCR